MRDIKSPGTLPEPEPDFAAHVFGSVRPGYYYVVFEDDCNNISRPVLLPEDEVKQLLAEVQDIVEARDLVFVLNDFSKEEVIIGLGDEPTLGKMMRSR